MKIKTKIPLTPELLDKINQLVEKKGHQTLSDLIEKLLRDFITANEQSEADMHDLQKINRLADRLNREAQDVLAYQVEL
jgi:metal-responsive CopG/Arc/MetJ family transcriptional regulator